jgi:paraquat-inducible protein A
MTRRNQIASLLTLVSLGCLIPGLTKPVLTISASISLLGNTREIFRETQSILESVRNLNDSGNTIVAVLILLFSILIPFIKAILVGVVLTARSATTQHRLARFVRAISKWSMADVFAVGTFIAFLAANALDNLNAEVGEGFYYFVAYCLLSNLAFQFVETKPVTAPA